MDYEARYEDLSRALEDLSERNRTAPVIVEGERDRKALEALGIRGDIRVVNRGTSLFRLCEDLAREDRGAIILTDWDERGGRLARQLRDGLAANGVRYDDEIRARLARLCRKEIAAVEELRAYVERLEDILRERDRSKPSKRWYSRRPPP